MQVTLVSSRPWDRGTQGIQQELLADRQPYDFENEDEQRACELAGKGR